MVALRRGEEEEAAAEAGEERGEGREGGGVRSLRAWIRVPISYDPRRSWPWPSAAPNPFSRSATVRGWRIVASTCIQVPALGWCAHRVSSGDSGYRFPCFGGFLL